MADEQHDRSCPMRSLSPRNCARPIRIRVDALMQLRGSTQRKCPEKSPRKRKLATNARPLIFERANVLIAQRPCDWRASRARNFCNSYLLGLAGLSRLLFAGFCLWCHALLKSDAMISSETFDACCSVADTTRIRAVFHIELLIGGNRTK